MAKNKYDILEGRKKELSDLAEFIADEYFVDTFVCPYKLANIYGISYTFEDYGNAFDGLLEHRSGKFHIYLNSRNAKHIYQPRVRFTLAHELGHYLIDAHRNALKSGLTPSHPSFTNFSSDNEVELEADFFASSLLIPKSRLLKDVFRRKFSFNLIEELATKYQTSITATLIKFASIGNHPIMTVCSVDKKIKWFKYSDDFPFKYIDALPGFKVPVNTSAGQYFYENGIKSDDEFEIIDAEDWFRLYNDNDYGRKFYESCIYSDRNKFVLSVIWED
jgi:Zn-dependent peptidase ImmA (M78 family)